jgi:hypothetical protein
VTDEYVASLEKRIEELEQQRANLSYIVRPYFKILTKDEKVACLQLYVKIKHGIDPLQEWIKMNNVVGVQPVMNYTIARDMSNMDDPSELSGTDIVSHFEAIGDKTWNGMVFRPGDDKHYNIADADASELRGIMLGLTGLSGFTYGSHTEPYVSKEERMAPMVAEITKQIVDWKTKTETMGSIGMSSRGLWQAAAYFNKDGIDGTK